MWTRFFDMSSGGDEKLGASVIWVEESEDAATDLFERIFGRDPYNVTCSCCGSDYDISERGTLAASNGDWVVTASDIVRFKSGNNLTVVEYQENQND